MFASDLALKAGDNALAVIKASDWIAGCEEPDPKERLLQIAAMAQAALVRYV
jgi:hypothetical protein